MFWGDPGFISNFVRGIVANLDSIGYYFLGGIFNIFFAIANAQFFQGDIIDDFYARIQMILGVFMIFRLSLTLLQIIVNPDMFKDRQKGAGSLVMRIAVMLVLLTLIVPIDIPEDGNTLNEKIRTNGILFGFLYQIQNTVVQDNVLGKLIIGYDIDSDSSQGNLELQGMENVGDILTAQIAHAFITPTLNEDSEYTEVTVDNYKNAAACPEDIAPSLNPLVTSGAMLDHVNMTCKPAGGDEIYAFSYIGIGGLIVSIVMTIIVLGFTLDVAVRAIKLGILRLIAPVPIISYISPGQEKDGIFGNWLKTLTSTYLSLFIRLIIIYFGIYLIILLRNDDLVTWVTTDPLANIFVIVGILVFMKEAPKFFQDMLGLKGDGKLFSGIGTMLGAAALTGGLAGSVVANAKTSFGEHQGKGHGMFRSALGAVGSGIAGGLGGAFVGGKALLSSDKNKASAVRAAQMKRNTIRQGGSTWWGRTKDTLASTFTGSSPADALDSKIEGYNTAAGLAKSIMDMADADGDWDYIDNAGVNHGNVKALKERAERLRYSGASETAIKAADDLYKQAQAARISAVLRGEGIDDGNFAPQMWQDYQNLRKLDKSYKLELLGDLDAGIENYDPSGPGGADGADKGLVGIFKAVNPVATYKARNVQNSGEYKARKVNKTK